MCKDCEAVQLPFTMTDLRLEFLNETGFYAEKESRMYFKWLEEKYIEERNSDCICK